MDFPPFQSVPRRILQRGQTNTAISANVSTAERPFPVQLGLAVVRRSLGKESVQGFRAPGGGWRRGRGVSPAVQGLRTGQGWSLPDTLEKKNTV